MRHDLPKNHNIRKTGPDLARQVDDFSTPQGRALEREERPVDWVCVAVWGGILLGILGVLLMIANLALRVLVPLW